MKRNGNRPPKPQVAEKEEIPVTKCPPGNAVGAFDEFKTQLDPRLGSLREFLFDPWNGCFHSRKAHGA